MIALHKAPHIYYITLHVNKDSGDITYMLHENGIVEMALTQMLFAHFCTLIDDVGRARAVC